MNEKSSKERIMIDMDRRTFMEAAGVAIAYAATVSAVPVLAESAPHEAPTTTISLTVNGRVHTVTVEDRTTLLDALRNQIGLTGTKKSCDRGECGACTVHIDGHRALACMSLAEDKSAPCKFAKDKILCSSFVSLRSVRDKSARSICAFRRFAP